MLSFERTERLLTRRAGDQTSNSAISELDRRLEQPVCIAIDFRLILSQPMIFSRKQATHYSRSSPQTSPPNARFRHLTVADSQRACLCTSTTGGRSQFFRLKISIRFRCLRSVLNAAYYSTNSVRSSVSVAGRCLIRITKYAF